MALSKKFHCVQVDRDRTPDLPKAFGVSAYPTLLLIGRKREKIHRFSGFKKPPALVAELEDGLRRFALYRKGEEWDEPLARPPTITEEGTVESFPAPSEEIASGLAMLGGDLLVAQQTRLAFVDRESGATKRTFALPPSVIDLCTDGTRLYAVEYGWTAGKPIHVLDPETGKTLRTIVTGENRKNRSMGAKGIAWRDGKLYVLDGMHGVLNEVDPETGAVTGRLRTEGRWLAGLAFDGTHFVAGSRDTLWWFDPETGKAARRVKLNYPLRSVGFGDGAYYLVEQPVFGHDKQHRRVRVWPKKTCVFKLTLNR